MQGAAVAQQNNWQLAPAAPRPHTRTRASSDPKLHTFLSKRKSQERLNDMI